MSTRARKGDARALGHMHAEAFHIMQYASDDGGVREWIWNSRDGVSPFVVGTRDNTTPMTHVSWGLDIYSPGHRPQPGDRVFVDLTAEAARQAAEGAYGRLEPGAQQVLINEFGTAEEAIRDIAEHLATPGAPHLVAVGPEGWKVQAAGAPAKPDYLDILVSGAVNAGGRLKSVVEGMLGEFVDTDAVRGRAQTDRTIEHLQRWQEALAFYAEANNYCAPPDTPGISAITQDQGFMARRAMGGARAGAT